MARITIAVGVLLSLIGVGFYAALKSAHGNVSATALIPAFFGVPLIILGVLAQNERRRRHAMHAAAVLGLLGLLGAAPRAVKLPALLSGAPVERPMAIYENAAMALVCLVFVALCVKSFIDARRNA